MAVQTVSVKVDDFHLQFAVCFDALNAITKTCTDSDTGVLLGLLSHRMEALLDGFDAVVGQVRAIEQASASKV